MPKVTSLLPKGYLGIDPGQGGGLGTIVLESTEAGFVSAIPMPPTEMDTWYAVKAHRTVKRAVIELVHSMPKQGVASSFKFGKNYGMLRGFLIAAGIPFEEVSPRKWQGALGITPRGKTETKTQFKNRLKALAQQWFPNVPITLKTADALLLAEYIRRKDQGLLEKK